MMRLLDAIYHGKVFNKESTADFFTVLGTNKDSWMFARSSRGPESRQ